MKKITAIGGGTGLSSLLRGLRDYDLEISAIVTMTDDGASSGRLRRETGILPPGDIRKCLAALSLEEGVILPLFEYRFKRGFGISGHSFGNLFISALTEMTGSFSEAIYLASKILQTKGDIIPATLDNVHLKARFNDGRTIVGESKITKYGYRHRIKEIFLDRKAKANPDAIKAIQGADLIVVGPGSLFTSIAPNFLLSGISDTFRKSKAIKIYISNVSTERGETENFKLSDHLRVFENLKISFDAVLANGANFNDRTSKIKDKYVKAVEIDRGKIRGLKIIEKELYNRENPLYHDTEKLGNLVYNIAINPKKYLG